MSFDYKKNIFWNVDQTSYLQLTKVMESDIATVILSCLFIIFTIFEHQFIQEL
jgi:hypothetical protein